jgi:hypothetical protein
LHVGVLGVSGGAALLGVEKVGKLYRVLYKEDGCVVANHIVVAILGVMLKRKTTRVTVAVVGSTLASHGGKSLENRCLLADLVKELGLAETKK